MRAVVFCAASINIRIVCERKNMSLHLSSHRSATTLVRVDLFHRVRMLRNPQPKTIVEQPENHKIP